MGDSDSDLSSLSSALSEPDEAMTAKLKEDESRPKIVVKGINKYFKSSPKDKKTAQRDTTPPPPPRAPSPPHEYTLADKDAIAFIVMFRSRFSDCFAASLPHYGPQDIERGVSGEQPDENVEKLLCALLSLCLNRKKPVEHKAYGRALEEAISEAAKRDGWPREWNGVNPLPGSRTFADMTADERLIMLRTIILWSMESSNDIKTALKQAYKQTRREDDKNQPKAVQPWFTDSWRRKYYLIEGQDDTYFRIYRENDGKTSKTNVWFSVAGSIEEAKLLADKFENEYPGNQGKIMAGKIRGALPRWEAGEEKRKKKEYRIAKKAQFTKPEYGFGIYEGRTRRGNRIDYREGENGVENSSRTASDRSTPVDSNQPVTTASGRQVRSRIGGAYGEELLTGQRRDADQSSINDDTDDQGGRPKRKSIPSERARAARGKFADGLESEAETDGDVDEEAPVSADEWSGNEDEPDDESEPEREDVEESDDELMDEADEIPSKMVVRLRYKRSSAANGDGKSVNGTADRNSTPLRDVQHLNLSAEEGVMDTSDTHAAPPQSGTDGSNKVTNGMVVNGSDSNGQLGSPPVAQQ